MNILGDVTYVPVSLARIKYSSLPADAICHCWLALLELDSLFDWLENFHIASSQFPIRNPYYVWTKAPLAVFESSRLSNCWLCSASSKWRPGLTWPLVAVEWSGANPRVPFTRSRGQTPFGMVEYATLLPCLKVLITSWPPSFIQSANSLAVCLFSAFVPTKTWAGFRRGSFSSSFPSA